MTPVVSDRKKLPAFFSIFWTVVWFAAGSVLIAAACSGSHYPEIWIGGLVLVLLGVFTLRSYFKKAPSVLVGKGTLHLNNAVYSASDITSVRHEWASRWNWAHTWNVLAVVLLIVLIVLTIASIFGEGGGDGFASIGDIFIPDTNTRKSEVMVLRFKDGSTRRVLSSMYHNYHQIREAIHTLTWSIRPGI